MRVFRYLAPLLLLASCASPAFADPVAGIDIGQTGIGYGATGSTFVPVSAANPLPVTFSGGDASAANQIIAQTSFDSIVSNTAVIAALNTVFGGPAEASITSGACTTLLGCTRGMVAALYDTSAAAVKISQSTTENDVDVATIAAGSNLIGKVDANIAINAPVRLVSAAGVTEDETQVCAAACTVLRVSGYNASASVRYIKFTNLTAANTTPGSSTVYWSIPIPATSPFSIPIEQYFSTAATVYLVTGAADNDATEVTAADILGLAVTTK
jgi:hypothetical protein